MSQSFQFERMDHLPRLAWCASVGDGGATRVMHGPWVESGAGWFAEGAWSGPYREGGFVEAATFMGSGGRMTDAGPVFAAPTHTLEKLYVLRDGQRTLVSNSLPFLLVQANDACDPLFLSYHYDLDTIIKGLDKYERRLPLKSGRRAEMMAHCNVRVGRGGKVETLPKTVPPAPRTFADYKGFLSRELTALRDNAGDPARVATYTPLATISSGYDSPCCAALAREVGCAEAITYTIARRNAAVHPAESDSGLPIGAALGLRMHEFDRESYRKRPDTPEAEFVACGSGGQDVVMCVLEDMLPGRMLFTGFHGDKIWDKHNKKIGPNIIRGDSSGMSLAEFRLRVGFINVAVPFMGCVNHEAIAKISNSPEMARWSLGTDYDRPIPRRITEEAGVPREAFGQKKKAVTQWVWSVNDMSPAAAEDFRAYMARAPFRLPRLKKAALKAVTWLAALEEKIENRRNTRALKSGRMIHHDPLIPDRYRRLPGKSLLTFHWGNEKLMERYRPKPTSRETQPASPQAALVGGAR